MSAASDQVAKERWHVAPVPNQLLVTIEDEAKHFIAVCLDLDLATQIVYVHNHWPGDDIVGPGGTRPPSRVPR